MLKHMTNWSANSWKKLPIKQQPIYDDKAELNNTLNTIKSYPTLVSPSEIRSLKKELATVCRGESFLLQGGDCAESFAEFNQDNLVNYFNVMMQMTVALMYGAGKPIVKVGRIAGQFAKPRSADFEEKDGLKLPSYRGDNVNSIAFTEKGRVNDPENLRKAYFQSAATLNYLRSISRSGEFSLQNIIRLNEEFASSNSQFAEIIADIKTWLKFIDATGISHENEELRSARFYVSHEGLLLPFEEALVRQDEKTGQHYACSAHMLWIGERTRALDEAHVEFFRGIANPVASKCGQTMEPDELIRLIDALNPENEEGKLTIIARYGADKIEGSNFPKLVERVKREGRNVIWSCDPMHGNTIKTDNGYKSRKFDSILSEIKSFFEIHRAEGTHAGGVHFEMTGQDVTECLGGSQDITELDLENRYHTHCDPRLNGSQALELAYLLANELRIEGK